MSGRIVALLTIGVCIRGIEIVEITISKERRVAIVCFGISPPRFRQTMLDLQRAAGIALFVREITNGVGIHIPHRAILTDIGNRECLPCAVFGVTLTPVRRVIGSVSRIGTILITLTMANDFAESKFENRVGLALYGIVVTYRNIFCIRQYRYKTGNKYRQKQSTHNQFNDFL